MPGGSFFSFTASLQYRADRLPSSCQERPLISNAPSRSRAILSRLTAEGSFGPRSVRENCHHMPSMRTRRPSFSIALRSFSLMTLICAGVAASSYRTQVRPRRSLGSFVSLAVRSLGEADQPSLRVARASDDMSRREVASAFPLLDLDRGVVDAEPARQPFDRLAEERVVEPNVRPHEMRRQGGLGGAHRPDMQIVN